MSEMAWVTMRMAEKEEGRRRGGGGEEEEEEEKEEKEKERESPKSGMSSYYRVPLFSRKGALFQITVFNVTGHFVKDMQRQLRELEEGQGMRLSKELSDEERRLVKAMAEEMGYAVTETSAGIEVTNLSTYATQIREGLSQLGVGETQRIQLSSATASLSVVHAAISGVFQRWLLAQSL
eukprot:s6663_g3.t1